MDELPDISIEALRECVRILQSFEAPSEFAKSVAKLPSGSIVDVYEGQCLGFAPCVHGCIVSRDDGFWLNGQTKICGRIRSYERFEAAIDGFFYSDSDGIHHVFADGRDELVFMDLPDLKWSDVRGTGRWQTFGDDVYVGFGKQIFKNGFDNRTAIEESENWQVGHKGIIFCKEDGFWLNGQNILPWETKNIGGWGIIPRGIITRSYDYDGPFHINGREFVPPLDIPAWDVCPYVQGIYFVDNISKLAPITKVQVLVCK